MGGYMNKELRCEPLSTIHPENKTCFNSEQFNTSVDGGGCTAENITSYRGEQCTEIGVVNDEIAVINKILTTVDGKLLREPFVELIQLNSSTLSFFNLQHSTRNDNASTTALKRKKVADSSNTAMKNTRLVNERRDDSTIQQLSKTNSMSSKSVNQLRVLSSSKKHLLTKKPTESYKNQGNDKISVSLCELRAHCETSQLNRSSNVRRKNSCATSIKSNTYVCDLCNKQCASKGRLIEHRRTHTGEKPFDCSFCCKAFSRKGSLDVHKKTHTGEKPFVCSFCCTAFSHKISLDKHKRTHTGEKPFVCSFCSKAFAEKATLTYHRRNHTGEKHYACRFCNKTFSRYGILKSHRRTHTGKTLFVCTFCSKAFSLKGSLVRHERTHTGEKPYACSVCSKTFSDNSYLLTHKRIHTGEKPYGCSFCANRFIVKSNCDKHERTHTGEKPYACSVCSKTFARNSNLNRHKITHT